MIALIKRKWDDPNKHEPRYSPRWTSRGTITKTELAAIMARHSTYSIGEVEGQITDFAQYILDQLLGGYTVDLQGFGKFSLYVSGKPQTDINKVTTEGVEVRIRFKPDKMLQTRLDTESKFKFVPKT